MRSTFKTVFYVNGSKERNGIVPIMGRVTINGTIAQFSCKLSVTKALTSSLKKHTFYNLLINNILYLCVT